MMAESSVERHEQDFEEFSFRVSVDNNGEIWVGFHESGKCAFSCSLDDLRTCVEFASRHGEHGG